MRSGWWQGDYAVTQDYGCTDYTGEPFNPNHPECPHWHDGIDVALPCSTNVICPVAATVVQVGVYGGGPYALILDIGGWWVWLLHLEVNYVQRGDGVSPGMVIAQSDNLGFSTGCHLHIGVTPAGGGYFDSVDPTAWLAIPSGGPGCALDIAAIGYTVGMILFIFHAILQWAEVLAAIGFILFLFAGFFVPFIRAIRR